MRAHPLTAGKMSGQPLISLSLCFLFCTVGVNTRPVPGHCGEGAGRQLPGGVWGCSSFPFHAAFQPGGVLFISCPLRRAWLRCTVHSPYNDSARWQRGGSGAQEVGRAARKPALSFLYPRSFAPWTAGSQAGACGPGILRFFHSCLLLRLLVWTPRDSRHLTTFLSPWQEFAGAALSRDSPGPVAPWCSARRLFFLRLLIRDGHKFKQVTVKKKKNTRNTPGIVKDNMSVFV